jgi:hypothetical protein
MPAPTTTTLVLVSLLKGFSDGVCAVAIQTEVVVPEVGSVALSRSVGMPHEKARSMPVQRFEVSANTGVGKTGSVLNCNKTSAVRPNWYGDGGHELKTKSPSESGLAGRFQIVIN